LKVIPIGFASDPHHPLPINWQWKTGNRRGITVKSRDRTIACHGHFTDYFAQKTTPRAKQGIAIAAPQLPVARRLYFMNFCNELL